MTQHGRSTAAACPQHGHSTQSRDACLGSRRVVTLLCQASRMLRSSFPYVWTWRCRQLVLHLGTALLGGCGGVVFDQSSAPGSTRPFASPPNISPSVQAVSSHPSARPMRPCTPPLDTSRSQTQSFMRFGSPRHPPATTRAAASHRPPSAQTPRQPQSCTVPRI